MKYLSSKQVRNYLLIVLIIYIIVGSIETAAAEWFPKDSLHLYGGVIYELPETNKGANVICSNDGKSDTVANLGGEGDIYRGEKFSWYAGYRHLSCIFREDYNVFNGPETGFKWYPWR